MNCPYGECEEEGSVIELAQHRHEEHGDPLPTFAEEDSDD